MYVVKGIKIERSGCYFAVVGSGKLPREITLDNTTLQDAGRNLPATERLRQVAPETMKHLQGYSQARSEYLTAELYRSQRYAQSGRLDFAPIRQKSANAQAKMSSASQKLKIKTIGRGKGKFSLCYAELLSGWDYREYK